MMSYEERVLKYLQRKKDQHKSAAYLKNAASTLRAFGEQYPEFTSDNVNSFLKKKAPASANTYLGRFKSFAKMFGIDLSEVEYRNVITDTDEIIALDSDELRQLIAAAKDNEIRNIIIVLSETGLRIHEFLQLNSSSIRFNKRKNVYEVKVLGKGRMYRSIPLSDKCKLALDLLEFPLSRKEQAICRNIRAVGEAAGLDFPVTPHTLRRTFACICLNERKIEIHEVMRIGGWTKADVLLKHYFKLDTGNITKAMNMVL